MARQKREDKQDEPFDLTEALKVVHPLHREGFRWFILEKRITNQKDFDKEYKKYGGFQ